MSILKKIFRLGQETAASGGSHTVAGLIAILPIVRTLYETTPAGQLVRRVKELLPDWLEQFADYDKLEVALPYIVGAVRAWRGQAVPPLKLENVLLSV